MIPGRTTATLNPNLSFSPSVPKSKFDLDFLGANFEFWGDLIRRVFSELKIPFRRLDAEFRDVIVTLNPHHVHTLTLPLL